MVPGLRPTRAAACAAPGAGAGGRPGRVRSWKTAAPPGRTSATKRSIAGSTSSGARCWRTSADHVRSNSPARAPPATPREGRVATSSLIRRPCSTIVRDTSRPTTSANRAASARVMRRTRGRSRARSPPFPQADSATARRPLPPRPRRSRGTVEVPRPPCGRARSAPPTAGRARRAPPLAPLGTHPGARRRRPRPHRPRSEARARSARGGRVERVARRTPYGRHVAVLARRPEQATAATCASPRWPTSFVACLVGTSGGGACRPPGRSARRYRRALVGRSGTCSSISEVSTRSSDASSFDRLVRSSLGASPRRLGVPELGSRASSGCAAQMSSPWPRPAPGSRGPRPAFPRPPPPSPWSATSASASRGTPQHRRAAPAGHRHAASQVLRRLAPLMPSTSGQERPGD